MLPPNTVQLEKAVKPLMNNMTILTEVSQDQQKKPQLTGTVAAGGASSDIQINNSTTEHNQSSYETSAQVISKPHYHRKTLPFENNQSQDSERYTETATEAQDHAKSPTDQHQCDELTRMKKKALIYKT